MMIIAILLLFLSIYIICFNWKSFYVQTILDEPYPSMIPFLGGILLFLSTLIILNGNYKYLSILYLFLDYGSLIFIFQNLITKNNKSSIKIMGFNISLISRQKKNKNLIYEYLNNLDDGQLEKIFYNLFNENKNNHFIKYELSDSNYYSPLLANEINNLFCKFKFLKVGKYYLNKEYVLNISKNTSNDNKFKIGDFLIRNIKEKKSLFIAEKGLILEDWNKNIFTELVCSIIIYKYKKKHLNKNIVMMEVQL